MNSGRAKYGVGQVVRHDVYAYRGVIVDVDPFFQQTDAWYDLMAKNSPPRDEPWYHVLVDGTDYMTYVSEQHLGADRSGQPINHPELNRFFHEFEDGTYKTIRKTN